MVEDDLMEDNYLPTSDYEESDLSSGDEEDSEGPNARQLGGGFEPWVEDPHAERDPAETRNSGNVGADILIRCDKGPGSQLSTRVASYSRFML